MADGNAVGKSITMYPEQWALLHQVSKDAGQGTISAGARFLITDWLRLKRLEQHAGQVAQLAYSALVGAITADEALEEIAGSPLVLGTLPDSAHNGGRK